MEIQLWESGNQEFILLNVWLTEGWITDFTVFTYPVMQTELVHCKGHLLDSPSHSIYCKYTKDIDHECDCIPDNSTHMTDYIGYWV